MSAVTPSRTLLGPYVSVCMSACPSESLMSVCLSACLNECMHVCMYMGSLLVRFVCKHARMCASAIVHLFLLFT